MPSTLREMPLSSQLYVWCDLLQFRELPYSNLKYGIFCVLVWRWPASEMSCMLFPTKKPHFIDLDQRERHHLLFTEKELTFKQPIFQIKMHGCTHLFKCCCWHPLTLTLGVNYIGLRLKIWGTKTAENLAGSYGGRHDVWHRNRWHGITSICPRTSKLQTTCWNVISTLLSEKAVFL